MKLEKTTVPIWFLEYLCEKIIQELIAEKVWEKNMQTKEIINSEIGNFEEIQTKIIIRDSLVMCILLFEAEHIAHSIEKNTHDSIEIDMKILKSGIEEFVDLRLDLIRENYRAIIDRLGTKMEKHMIKSENTSIKKNKRKKELVQIVGRLDDPNYLLFTGHYYLL